MFFIAAMSGSTIEPVFMIGMFIVVYVIAMIAYKYEAGKAKRFLINLFGEQKFIPDNRYPTADFFDLLIKKNKGA